MTPPIYLDYNATTPIDPGVAAAMRPYLDGFFGNPSSNHWYGLQTRGAVEKARGQVAALIGADAGDVIFTSGGSESNNHALKGAAFALRSRGDHIVTSAVEHPAVSEVCRFLGTRGFSISTLPVDGQGMVDPSDLEAVVTPRTILLSVMHANNETGTIQPIAELAEVAHRHGIVVHSDAAQSVGKIPVDVVGLGVDLLSVAGHKFYGPKGVGALYVRPGIALEKLVHGANHERNRRAGTENVLEVVGLGAAAGIAAANLEENAGYSRGLRDLLWDRLRDAFPGVRLNGHPVLRLPNTLNVSLPGIGAGALLAGARGVAASAGAACHAEAVEVSNVMAAMNVPRDFARGAVRFSTGKFLTAAEVEEAADEVIAAARRLVGT